MLFLEIMTIHNFVASIYKTCWVVHTKVHNYIVMVCTVPIYFHEVVSVPGNI